MVLTAAAADPDDLDIVGCRVRLVTGFRHQLGVQLRHIPGGLVGLAHRRPCRFGVGVLVGVVAVGLGDHPLGVVLVGPVQIVVFQLLVDLDARGGQCLLGGNQPVGTHSAGPGTAGAGIVEGPARHVDGDGVGFGQRLSVAGQGQGVVLVFQKHNAFAFRPAGQLGALGGLLLRGHALGVQAVVVGVPVFGAGCGFNGDLCLTKNRIHDRAPVFHHAGDHDGGDQQYRGHRQENCHELAAAHFLLCIRHFLLLLLRSQCLITQGSGSPRPLPFAGITLPQSPKE